MAQKKNLALNWTNTSTTTKNHSFVNFQFVSAIYVENLRHTGLKLIAFRNWKKKNRNFHLGKVQQFIGSNICDQKKSKKIKNVCSREKTRWIRR